MRILCFIAFRATLADRRGATAIEYGLIAVLVAIAGVAGMKALGGSILGLWTDVNAKVAAVSVE